VVVIREVLADDWMVMRDIRLEALREAPYAFGSTYAREAPLTEGQWRGRISDRAVTYLAYLPAIAGPAGIAGVYVEDGASEDLDSGEDSSRAELISMWVRPSARGRKVGEALIEATAAWATANGFDRLSLWVTESNEAARGLYERCGFTPTGARQPLPSDPTVPEIRMYRSL
jgi:ribosomal protein S18 acetylase RimI-like enzyme